jgi:hypothetical protein
MKAKSTNNKLHSNDCVFFSYWALRPLSWTMASLTTDDHPVLSKALVLCIFTPVFFKPNSTSSIHHNIGLPFSALLLVCLAVTSLLPFHHPFLQHAQPIPSASFDCGYNISKFKFIISHILLDSFFYSPINIFVCRSFPTSVRLFPF